MPPFATTSSRWAALQSRDHTAATAFIYSVTTTRIYCRPTCPSRLARRANIVFHENFAAAEADGFRPCKRCRPDVIENDGDSQKAAVAKACQLLRKDSKDGLKMSLKMLAAEVGLTECHFCRVFKKVMGVTVGNYRKQIESQKSSGDAKNETGYSIIDSDGMAMSNTPLDHLLTPDGSEFSTVLPTFTQEDIDNFSRIALPIHDLEYFNSCDYETLVFDQPTPGLICVGTGEEDIFDFVDFGNQTATWDLKLS